MSRLSDAIEDAAASWDARLRGGKGSFRDRQAFHAWLQEDGEHQVANDRLQAALGMLRANAELPELSALRDEARNSVHENRRRRIVSVAALVIAALLVGLLVTLNQTNLGAGVAALAQGETVYATSPNERTRVALADGSIVTLDAGSRLSARLGASRRDITMLAGRALFQVAKDRHRPFVVKAGDRTITALGTVFDVRLSPEELRVTLAEGSVVVRAVHPGRGSTQQILKPNQQLVEVAGAATPELRTVNMDRALSWADGQVFFEDEPLASAVEEMNQYARLKIKVDPAIADLRINGMFRMRNQAQFLDALEMALPVKVRRDEQGQIFVSRRPDRAAD